MTGPEYLQIQMAILELGRHAEKLDIEGFIKTTETALINAPRIDKEFYQKSVDNLSALQALALAVKNLKDKHLTLKDRALATAAKWGNKRDVENRA